MSTERTTLMNRLRTRLSDPRLRMIICSMFALALFAGDIVNRWH
jgi:hypothetical protein